MPDPVARVRVVLAGSAAVALAVLSVTEHDGALPYLILVTIGIGVGTSLAAARRQE